MTHREAIDKLASIFAHSPVVCSGAFYKWFRLCESDFIPLIHVPEAAKIMGCEPSEIDDYFIGKDKLTIDWSEK